MCRCFKIVLACFLAFGFTFPTEAKKRSEWTREFYENVSDFSTTGSNKYFILEPLFQLVLEGKEEGEKIKITITVLDETKVIGGIETRIVEEREQKDEKLVEVSRNYYAISRKTSNVYYFGEDVDIYKDGKVIKHSGSWIAGKDNANYGLMMPGSALIGSKYYQEIAPKAAMDRAENISVTETFKSPAGRFNDCLKTQEGSALKPWEKEYKYYAPNIGLIKDGPAILVKYGFVNPGKQ